MNKQHVLILLFAFTFIVPRVCAAQGHHGDEEHGDHAEEKHDEHEEGLHIDKDMQKTIGLSFEKAQFREYTETIKVYGEIAQDTDKYTHITSKINGEVKKVYVQTGAIVNENEPILSIVKKDDSIETITAPHHGTVIAIHVKPQDKVDNLRSLASLTDLDKLRVSFNVYEKDLRFVSVGQTVSVYSTAYPGKVFKGKVVFLSPRIDKHSQTIKIRAEVDNHDHLLRLGMFVTGDLIFTTGGDVLSVTQSAVQHIDNENIVFVSEGDEFEAKDIKTGREFGEFIEITEGLHEGEKVVSKGSFALKSELQKGKFGDGHAH